MACAAEQVDTLFQTVISLGSRSDAANAVLVEHDGGAIKSLCPIQGTAFLTLLRGNVPCASFQVGA